MGLGNFARQLTAFLPSAYPLSENPMANGESARRQGKTKILLLENINMDAAQFLKDQGYEVTTHSFLLDPR